MTPPPINIDGSDITGATIDGTDVQEVTVDGTQVFSAIPDAVVDNFEDANADPAGAYESGDTISTYYNRDTGQFSRTATNVLEGSNSVQVESGASPGWIWSAPSDGLPRYFVEGDTARFLIRGPANMQFPALLYGSPDGTSGYSSVLDTNNGSIEIRRFDSGSISTIQSSSVSVSASVWYWGQTRVPASDDQTNNVSPNLEFELYNVDTTSGISRGSLIGTVSVTDYNHSGRYHGVVNHDNASADATILDGIKVV